MAELGAHFDTAGNTITFRVFASQATRLELWIYNLAVNSQENLRLVMTRSPNDTNVFEQIVSLADLKKAGVTNTVFYLNNWITPAPISAAL